LLVAGLILGVLGGRGIIGSIEDPREVAVIELEFETLEEEEKIETLEEGSYEIWIEGEDIEINLQVLNEDGEDILEDSRSQHSISIGEKSYEKVGELDIPEDGDYTFITGDECTLYVTEPISSVFEICGSITLMIIGGIILLIGITLVISGIKKKEKSRRHESFSLKEEPPPPQKSTTRTCPTCGEELRYIDDYESWYCDNCQHYK